MSIGYIKKLSGVHQVHQVQTNGKSNKSKINVAESKA